MIPLKQEKYTSDTRERKVIKNNICLWNTNAPDNCQFQRWPRSQGHIFWYQWKDLVTRNDCVQYGSSFIYILEVMTNVKVKKLVPTERIYHRNTNVKYQSSSSHYSNIINKVKNLKMYVKLQGQGLMVKNVGTNGVSRN